MYREKAAEKLEGIYRTNEKYLKHPLELKGALHPTETIKPKGR